MPIFKKATTAMAPQMLPPSMFPTSGLALSSPQIIENRYIDDDKLLGICKERFGTGNYKLRVSSLHGARCKSDQAYILKYKFHRWYLLAPCVLDEVSRQT